MRSTRLVRGEWTAEQTHRQLIANVQLPEVGQFRKLWYETPGTWGATTWRGVGVMKAPTDLWSYQELINEVRPRIILETGSAAGGSALFFADLLQLEGIEGGRVVSIDIDPRPRPQHPLIEWVEGSSVDPLLKERLAPLFAKGPRLISLDSEHTAEHVHAELCLWTPLLESGDVLVVEDTNFEFDDESGSGPAGGLNRFLAEHQGEWAWDLWRERFLLTMHPGGWLRKR